jgi:UDP-N-acetyl-2-amino-2-deoxyglucuronate dehydrogenase
MEPDMRKTRIAIVGTGLAATPHALALNDLRDEVEVVGVLGRSRERLESFAHQYGFPLGESFEKMLNDPGVDAILVLTPPHTHLDLVLQAAAAGKHVLLEKPLDISTQRAERLVQACRDADVRLGVVFQNRFRPAVQRLAALVQEGSLGPLVYAGLDLRWWRPQSYYDEPGRGTYARDGGGVLMTQAIHSLDLLMWLAGDVSSVTGATARTSQARHSDSKVARPVTCLPPPLRFQAFQSASKWSAKRARQCSKAARCACSSRMAIPTDFMIRLRRVSARSRWIFLTPRIAT